MPQPAQSGTLSDLLEPYARRCAADLGDWLIEPGTPPELAEAMTYCTAGGKRLRASLVLLAAETGPCGAGEMARRTAVAVECVHAYSLVHDDLPAMDDDTLRRGQPTAHVKFGEAMAILTGDALLTRAFGLLAEGPGDRQGELAGMLAGAAGPAGMIAGQVADMDLCSVSDGVAGVEYIHQRKTAALIQAAAALGAVCGGSDPAEMDRLSTYGYHLGMAFQYVDDLLDVTGQSDQLGKTPGKDASAGKRTTVAVLGLEETRRRCQTFTRRACDAIEPMGDRAEKLLLLARHLAGRSH
ncbi:MAG: polyprenyl synthetase family protein [Phycisphaerae bacterium]